MVVPTDRRAYYVRLQSKPAEYLARVASWIQKTAGKHGSCIWPGSTSRTAREGQSRSGVATLPNTAIENLY